MFQLESLPERQLTALDKLNSFSTSELKAVRARLSDCFDCEVDAWADAVENHNPAETIEHWRAALALSEQLKTVTWIICVKTYPGEQ